MPAVLNNAIDWLSRPYGAGALVGKPFAVVGATPTPYGGKWAHQDTRRSAGIAGAVVLEHIEVSQSAIEGDILADADVVGPPARRRPRPGRLRARGRTPPDPPPISAGRHTFRAIEATERMTSRILAGGGRGRLGAMSELTPYICVADSRAAIEWYVDVLGAEVTYQPIEMPDGRIGHVELAVDGARWMMSDEFAEANVAPPDAGRGNAVSLHLTVTDVDAVAARVVAAGVTLDRGPEDSPPAGRVAVFRDPFGHRWFLNQPFG